MSTAGARRRYQRTVPRVIARMAERCGEVSNAARAASADHPSMAMEVTARAASASVCAPGAQGALAKATTCQVAPMCEIPGSDRPAPRALHLL